MQWLSHDGVLEDDLPPWAQEAARADWKDGAPYRVSMRAEGIVLRRGDRLSAVPWEDILVPIRVEGPPRLLLATTRRPPRLPWFELRGHDIDEIEGVVRSRTDAVDLRSYREGRRRRAVVPPDEVLTRVLAREPLPGAVEIPAATPSPIGTAFAGAVVGGITVGLYGLMIGPLIGLAAGGLGILGGGGLMAGLGSLRRRAAGRVLVLTPDAFVGGLDGQSVRSVPWSRVGRFMPGVDHRGEDVLVVLSPAGQRVVTVNAKWFGQPLDVITAVAEAYRERATDVLPDGA